MKEHTPGCGGCCGGGCSANDLILTEPELRLLSVFAQLPFLPISRRADSELPVCLEDEVSGIDQVSEALFALEQKGLCRLDYDIPLNGFDYASYSAYPYRGSAALTHRGIEALELMDLQGIGE